MPRKLPVLDALASKKVYYRVPRISDYDGEHLLAVGGGDAALDVAVMDLQRRAIAGHRRPAKPARSAV